MDSYITGGAIKGLRESKKMTQAELASILCISDKTVSKWETGKGFPDIALIEPLAAALQVSVPELLSGKPILNRNVSCNLTRSKLYICPVCGNIIHTTGEALISCCGVTFPVSEAEDADCQHLMTCVQLENEYVISMEHSMTKQHYISFFAYVTQDSFELRKLYAESSAEARFFSKGQGIVYGYCNQHGLFQMKV